MTTLIISEKPKAAERIASALADGSVKRGKSGQAAWFEITSGGKRILVVPAVGHLFTLKQKGDGHWTYPIFETEWVPTYEANKSSAFSKAYLYNFKKLSGEADDFIVATDYDSEGSVIGFNILRFVCMRENAKRMKFSTLTASELRESYEKASPELDFPQIEAGLVRHTLDWLYGINASRALTLAIKKASSYFKVLSTGRVQGPALRIVAKREKEIKKFVKQPYWELEAELKTKKGETLKAKHVEGKFWEKDKAQSVKDKCGKDAVVSKISKRKYKHNPPTPFDLTTLQTEAYGAFGFTPTQTLDIAQSLYDSGLISYPRTSSQKLPARLGLKDILEKIAKQKEYRGLVEKLFSAGNFSPNEGKKDDPAHPAIFPTGEMPKELNKWEEKLYDLVVRRFLAVFCEPAIRESIDVTFDINKEEFVSNGKRTLEKNWIEFYEDYVKYEEQLLPDLKKGDVLEVLEVLLLEKETQPPSRYNEASLVKELEKLNLGTKATRASIIQTLYDRGYIKERKIEVTELGFAVVETLEKYCPEMLSEKLTREFEEDMEEVEKGKRKKEKVIEDAKKTLAKILKDFKDNEDKIGAGLQEASVKTRNNAYVLGTCPKCGKKLRMIISRATRKRFVGCEGYKDGCKNSFPLPQEGKIEHAGNCKECGLPMIKVIRKGRRPYQMCIDPKCPSKADWGNKSQENDKSE